LAERVPTAAPKFSLSAESRTNLTVYSILSLGCHSKMFTDVQFEVFHTLLLKERYFWIPDEVSETFNKKN
jgi:hypothetical protein